jgi:hypothetical protein
MYRTLFFLAFLNLAHPGFGQDPFQIIIEPVEIPGVLGLQSYACAEFEGKWLIVGGRLDGLHRRQPWASFDLQGHNSAMMVLDLDAGQYWVSQMDALPLSIREQLRSTNMSFIQNGQSLYCVGGYGFSTEANDHITFPYISVIDVPAMIDAVVNGTDGSPWVEQISDQTFAVSGGQLKSIGDTFYLIGGNRFDGRYNPMGNPTFTQVYTNAVRRFTVIQDGGVTQVAHLPEWVNAAELHRRDFNAAHQIFPDGSEGITAFSGVFRPDADLPFLHSANITEAGVVSVPDFAQYFNHYHCAHLELYSEAENEMHTLFFGGISQYYESGGQLVQDDNAPFVRTIARVTRYGDGSMAEFKLPVEMPGYMGAGSEFLRRSDLPIFGNGVIKLDSIEADTTLLGYIFGGIHSSADNIFWVNDGTQSAASAQLFAVSLVREESLSSHFINVQSTNTLALQVYPNPASKSLQCLFMAEGTSPFTFHLLTVDGQVLKEKSISVQEVKAGQNQLSMELENLGDGIYILECNGDGKTASQRIMVGH